MRDELNIPLPAGGPSYRAVRRSSALDPATRRLALVAGGIGGALLLLVGAWSFTGHHRRGIPVIEAAAGPVRVRPDKPGGLEVFGGDDAIISGAQDGKEAMAPPPELPDPQGLRSQEPKPPAIVAAPTVPLPAQAATPAPVAADLAAKSAPARLASPARPVQVPAASIGGGTSAMQVQFAALPTEQAAQTEWARLAHKMPDLLGSRQPAVTKTERDGNTWYRLRTGGFANTAEAAAFCQHVREKGGGCTLASF